MTDEPTPEENSGDVISQIRDEMNQQFSALRESFEAQLSELRAANEKLLADNNGLKAALVRSAMSDSPREPPKEKTPEELAAEKEDELRQYAIRRTNELVSNTYKE